MDGEALNGVLISHLSCWCAGAMLNQENDVIRLFEQAEDYAAMERATARQPSVGLQPSVSLCWEDGGGGTLAGPHESDQVGIEIVGSDGEFAEPLCEARDLFPSKNAAVLRKNRRDRQWRKSFVHPGDRSIARHIALMKSLHGLGVRAPIIDDEPEGAVLIHGCSNIS